MVAGGGVILAVDAAVWSVGEPCCVAAEWVAFLLSRPGARGAGPAG